MDFQRARTPEQIENRQNEIISACKQIYLMDGYEEVTLKKISEITSFTRPAIYSYYKTKEEIFMDILKEEFALWQSCLENDCSAVVEHSRIQFCKLLSDSLCERTTLLELLAVHLNTIENNTSIEKLVEFKETVYKCFDVIHHVIDLFFPDTDAQTKNDFFDLLVIFLNGLYPYVFHSKIQKEAMKLAGRPHIQKNLHEVCYRHLLLMTTDLK